MLDLLPDQRLIFVTGKGGVGKSTCTAGLADTLSRQGKKVLIVETDTYSAMGDLLGGVESTTEPVLVRENLWAVNLRSAECLVQTLIRYMPSERVVRAITSNKVTEAFFQSAPSVNEFVLLDQIQSFAEESDYDHIVVDLPASGHAVSFLSVPRTLHGMMRGVGPIARRAEQIAAGIEEGEQSAVVAICLPEEMPVNETIELSESLEQTLGRGLTLTFANMVHRSPIDEDQRDALSNLAAQESTAEDPVEILAREESSPIQRLIAGNILALSWFDRDRRYLDILHATLPCPVIEVPMLYETRDEEIVSGVVGYLIEGVPPKSAETLAS